MLNAMQPFLGFHVGGVSSFRRRMCSEVNELAANSDRSLVRNPAFFLLRPDTEKPCRAALARALEVLTVFRKVRLPQVGNSVVGFFSVDVVDQHAWPLTVDVKPSKSVCPVAPSCDSNFYVAVLIRGSRFLPNSHSASVHAPSEHSRLWVVVQKLFQLSLRDCIVVVSHVVAPYQRSVGQRLEGVGSTFLPRSIIGEVA